MPNGLDRGGWGVTKIVTASNLKDCEMTKFVTGRKLLEKYVYLWWHVIKAGKVLSGWKFNLKLNRDKVGNEDLATFPSCDTQLSNVKYIKFKIYTSSNIRLAENETNPRPPINKNLMCKKFKSALYLGSLWNIPMHKIKCIFLIFNLVLHCPSPAQWSFRIILVFLQSTLQMNTQSSLSANMNNECQRQKKSPKVPYHSALQGMPAWSFR